MNLKDFIRRVFGLPEYRACPRCEGTGEIWIQKNGDGAPDPADVKKACPLCGGEKRIAVFVTEGTYGNH